MASISTSYQVPVTKFNTQRIPAYMDYSWHKEYKSKIEESAFDAEQDSIGMPRIQATIEFNFRMEDSARGAGQDSSGMPLPGKQIVADYLILTEGIKGTAVSIHIFDEVDGKIQIDSKNTYQDKVAKKLWNRHIAPLSNHAIIDLRTRVVTLGPWCGNKSQCGD